MISVLSNGSQFRDFREVVILPGDDKEFLVRQQSIFEKEAAGFRERDVKITVCTTDSCRKKYKSSGKAGEGFRVLLVGKDGGVKSEWNRLVQNREIFALIDAMPMRRSEMKRNP